MLGAGELTVDDFLEAEQAAESANSDDTPEQFLTRLRQLPCLRRPLPRRPS
jgi:hypothetical protein